MVSKTIDMCSIRIAPASGDAEQMTGSPREAIKGKKNTRKYNSESKAEYS